MPTDFARLVVAERGIEMWTEYSIRSSLMTAADSFSMSFRPGRVGDGTTGLQRLQELRDVVAPGADVQLYIGDKDVRGNRRADLQLTGVIDERTIDGSRSSGPQITVKGRDLAAHPADSSVPMTLLKEAGTNFLDVVRAALTPWGIAVLADPTASRDILTGKRASQQLDDTVADEALGAGIPPSLYTRDVARRAELTGKPVDEVAGVDPSSPTAQRARERASNKLTPGDVERLTTRQAKPRAGETVWAFLERHAHRLGLMMWMAPDGKLVVGSPNYTQPPLYRLIRRFVNRPEDPNTILSGGATENAADRYSEVKVYGRKRGKDVERSQFVAVETDDEVPYVRRLVIHDNSVTSEDEAARRAKRELHRAKANGTQLQYSVPYHGQGAFRWAIDAQAFVDDEWSGIRGTFYITDRRFTRDRSRGPMTSVQLVPSGAILL